MFIHSFLDLLQFYVIHLESMHGFQDIHDPEFYMIIVCGVMYQLYEKLP